MKVDTVCIIDDDPIFVYGTKVLLNNNGNFCSNILVYENGREALDVLETMLNTNEFPDVIFLDLNMPVMNGWQFLEKFCKLPRVEFNTRIYILSSSVDPADIQKAKNYKIVKDFISKPLTADVFSDLLSVVEKEVDFKNV
ncbi:response regulator [Cellulophaga sp. HaHaR_3_176]|uniref:response regulator n=1 Tax=Cellulophaga sp. HaHaR_3_176 TaxID=1942464 RepID=UPI001C1F5DEE|nr:response regulator [Cellulophaga sp. HaHaR_3_176]QWX84353.1 response regulator [Cellulophaga sp. HaHaR_3_176]